ncbi:MAG: alcohol dehydrogenase catalytic domain-containing protein [Trueperaceae bacterium]|nr:alcohol dehydrogenase catalytic domain-containing protein [Trueperaceae bacterium]
MSVATQSKMKVAVMQGAHHIDLGEKAKPSPKEGEVLIKVQACSVCGSDLHYYHEGAIGAMQIKEPFTPGHEFAGIIIEGTGKPFGLEDGTLVAVDPAQPCGKCEWCHSGNHHLCPDHLFVGGPPTDGAMAEYIAVPFSTVHVVPQHFSAQQAALLEPLGIAIHALDLAKLRPGSDVCILGAGPIGLYISMLAQRSGAVRVSMIDPLAYRRDFAKNLSADAVFENVESYLDYTKGRGADVIFEATTSPEGPDLATQAVRIGGKVILVGIPDGDKFTLTASLVRRKGLTIKLSRRMGHIYPRAIQYVDSGKLDVNAIVSHVMPLSEVKKAFELLSDYKDNAIKIVLEP